MIRFERLDEGRGVRIVDPVERRRYALRTDEPVAPRDGDPDAFGFPVDAAADVETAALSAPIAGGTVRDADHERVAAVQPGTDAELPAASYTVELSGPVKLYLHAEGPLRVTADPDRVRVDFDGERRVRVGARSYHTRPAGTITVPDGPAALLEALPLLASSLKTTTCERSFPTLRGHPPLLERGGELSVPDAVERPDTGVVLEVPAEYGSLYVAAPLAFYLGADLRPAAEPRLRTGSGFERDLAGPDGFEREVGRVLRQVFLLDCVTRTEGLYPVDLAERAAVESAVDLDFAALYGRSLGRQLAAYLSVPFERVADAVPRWGVTAHLPPNEEHAAALPYVLADLGLVRTASGHAVPPEGARAWLLDGVVDAGRARAGRDEDGWPPAEERPDDAAASNDDGRRFVRPAATGSMGEAWFGDGVPLDATKATLAALDNRLADDSREGSARVAVVCNDAAMLGEGAAVERTYGSRPELPFDVSVHECLRVADLRDLLRSDLDLLHYVGHVDADGIACRDGGLDARTLSSVGVRAFLLNACASYEQGLALVEAGAVGGVVTLNGVVNSGALAVGRAVARLLDLGFPLRAALAVAREHSVLGGQYVHVGDGRVDVAQDGTGIPILPEVTAVEGDACELRVTAYLPREGGMGSLAYPLVVDDGRHYLAPGELGRFTVPVADVREALDRGWCPVRVDGDLVFPDDGWDP